MITRIFVLTLFLGFLAPFFSYAAVDTWETVTPPGTNGYTYDTIVSVEDRVFVGTSNGVYKSEDAGQTWTAATSGLTDTNVREIAIAWVYDDFAYDDYGGYVVETSTQVTVATAGGVFLGTVGGSSWTVSNSGLTDTDVYDIEYDSYEIAGGGPVTTLYAATPSGVFRSVDSGANWTLQDTGMPGVGVVKLASDWSFGYLHALTDTGLVYGSELLSASFSDESWSQIYAGSPAGTDINLLDPLGDYVWLSTVEGIRKDDGTGSLWTDVGSGLATGIIRTVRSDYADTDIAYAAHATNGVYRTTDEAASSPAWFPINQGLTDLDIKDLRTTVGSSTLVYAAGASGVYRLTLSDTYADLTPPAAITDLVASSTSGTSVQLTWTSPGDDLDTGNAVAYSIRYATSSNTITNDWENATIAPTSPSPLVAGTVQTVSVTGLTDGVRYYFGIKTVDDGAGYGDVSNVADEYAGGGSDVTPPTVSISAPTNGSTVSGSSVTVSASAVDNIAVVGVQFKLDGVNLGSEDTSSPYSIVWDSNAASDAAHTLTAITHDAAGNYATSSDVVVTVSNPSGGSDVTPPTVSISAPTNGSTVSGSSVTVSASAVDNIAVVGVQFKLDGVNLGSEDTSSPYSIVWDSNAASDAAHTLTAITHDAAGNYATSSDVVVTVSNPSGGGGGSSSGGSGRSNNTDVVPNGGAEDVSTLSILSWEEDSDAIEYIIYLGVSSIGYDDEPFATTTANSFALTYSLETSTKYYWRIDIREKNKESRGVRYSFTTGETSSADVRYSFTTGETLSAATSTPIDSNLSETEQRDDLLEQINQLNQLIKLIAQLKSQQNAQPGIQSSVSIVGALTRPLKIAMEGNDVKTLQQILNAKGYRLTASGAGSPGYETAYFGPATLVALKRFQCAELNVCSGTPLTTGYGQTGPITRAKLNAY
ncbi:MAG: hypothetical protein ACI9BF_000681 [Candidatus Paceibacteria bacterium]|jgi:hypothetical protein